MQQEKSIVVSIRESAQKKILFLSHAVRQMNRPDRMITPAEVRTVIQSGELIEDYPDDARGHSCLLFGMVEKNRAIHVVCAPKEDYLAVITAYIPSELEWKNNFRERIKK